MRQYISDVITETEILKWKQGQRILIHAQTGSGKSQFVKNELYSFCVKNNKTLLLLSNRNLLKAQNEVELSDKLDIITLANYQQIEASITNGDDVERLFEKFDYIVYDEAHYLFSDSQFNRSTDLMIEPLRKTPPHKIFLFITATPESVLEYQPEFDFQYTLPFDYSYIKNLFFYEKEDTIYQIISNIPHNEKIIYFSSKAFDAYETSIRTPESVFLCSEFNKDLAKKSSKATIKEIANDNKFSARLLCTTKVLDNGVNIIDRDVRHIIIDMLEPITLIQCLGRKRIVDENDTINVYVRNYHGGLIYAQIVSIDGKLAFAEELNQIGIQAFQTKYARKTFDDIVQNDFQINQAKYYYLLKYRKSLAPLMNDPDKNGYKKMVCTLLQKDIAETKVAEETFEKKTLSSILEYYIGKQMFENEREEFKNIFFENLFSPKNSNYRKRGLLSINAILEEDGLPYRISSIKEKSRGINRDKKYWIVIKVE